jgi:hypothetical protein
MGERVTISYRGTAYELGRGKRCYGIWAAGAPRSEAVERWPETPEGWVAAWTKFTAMEPPGTIAPVGQHQVPGQAGPAGPAQPDQAQPDQAGPSGPGPQAFSTQAFAVTAAVMAGDTVSFGQPTASRRAFAPGPMFAAALLAVGVICGVVGLFPGYQVGVSLASAPANLIPHVAYIAVWALAAVLIVLRVGATARAGALLAVGTSVVTFGLFGADLGQGFHLADAGLWISLVGWLACTAGAALAFLTTSPGTLARPNPRGIARAALLIVAGIGVALTFFPNWDSYLLHSSTTGQSEAQAAGSAFASSTPGWVQAADVAVMVLFILIVAVAALWRPLVAGAMLLAGACIPMAAQAVSAMVGATEPTSPATFGISAAQAQQLGLTITNGLTPAFWIFCLFVVTLLVSCAWMLITPSDGVVAESGPAPVIAPEHSAEPDGAAAASTEDSAGEESVGEASPWTAQKLAADATDDRA